MTTVAAQRGMMGTLKQFDSASHAVYDTKGKEAMIKFLNDTIPTQFRTIENPNEYGIDLLTLNEFDKVVYCWEIEVRHGNWRGDVKFPFNEINCIERKDYQWRKDQKMLDQIPYKMNSEYDVFYVQMNDLCNRAVVIEGNKILQHNLKPWANRKADGEYVRQVPINETTQIKL